jgi:mRNA interferase YafQ
VSAPQVLEQIESSRFCKDVAFVRDKRRKDMSKLRQLISLLASKQPLPRKYQDHPLKGEWAGFRECHIESYDWLLIYYTTRTELVLVRTGSHSDLFGG